MGAAAGLREESRGGQAAHTHRRPPGKLPEKNRQSRFCLFLWGTDSHILNSRELFTQPQDRLRRCSGNRAGQAQHHAGLQHAHRSCGAERALQGFPEGGEERLRGGGRVPAT